ncbi:MAG: hypothetical protein HC802_12340 [Caldilineaceae bacterium]|nr:hypothetical protein [Caldilineaceae bacterium]
MSQLTLVSPDERPIKPLVESALLERAKRLEAAIRQTEIRLTAFEKRYGLNTGEFLTRFAQNQYQHSDDYDDWIGESRMLDRLREKLNRLESITIVD